MTQASDELAMTSRWRSAVGRRQEPLGFDGLSLGSVKHGEARHYAEAVTRVLHALGQASAATGSRAWTKLVSWPASAERRRR